MRKVYRRCPFCAAENAITCKIGRRFTAAVATCIHCEIAVDYSAWNLSKRDGVYIDQVDLPKRPTTDHPTYSGLLRGAGGR